MIIGSKMSKLILIACVFTLIVAFGLAENLGLRRMLQTFGRSLDQMGKIS